MFLFDSPKIFPRSTLWHALRIKVWEKKNRNQSKTKAGKVAKKTHQTPKLGGNLKVKQNKKIYMKINGLFPSCLFPLHQNESPIPCYALRFILPILFCFYWYKVEPFSLIDDQKALCTTRSHDTKLNILVNKLSSGTSKTKAGALFWKSHRAICSPVYLDYSLSISVRW